MNAFLRALRRSAAAWLLAAALQPSAFAVIDTDPPVLNCPERIEAVALPGECVAIVEFEITATDDSPIRSIVSEPPSGARFPVGVTRVRTVATDAGGNSSSCEFDVVVMAPVTGGSPCGEEISVPADLGQWGATVDFRLPAIDDSCVTGEVFTEPAPGTFFPVGETKVTAVARLPWGDVPFCSFNVVVEEPDNIVWPRALELPLVGDDEMLTAEARQALIRPDESRWFKFPIHPGSRVIATLTSLPANYDLVLFKDIAQAYRELTSVEDLPQLDAEFADDAFSPAQFSPAQFSPAQFSPAAFSPAQFSPAQFSPAQFSPAQFSPAQFSPAQFSPDAFSPAQFSPAQFSPAQFSPAQFSPAQFSPAQFSGPVDEQAYSSAQIRSVIAVSAFDGLSGEGVVGNTWLETGYFYLRVRGRQGAFDPEATFQLNVYVFPGLCDNVISTPPASPEPPLVAPPGGYRTLIVTDLDRLAGPGASPERDALVAKLAELAARPEVQGYVLDVSADPDVAFFMAQADTQWECPYAVNLVAEAIRAVIERSRAINPVEYLILVGNDTVIPFFRHPDEALLGPEVDYIPPVFEFTSSQASLRNNFFLSQDRYGATCDLVRKTSSLPIPDLAIGRLIETPAEIIAMIEAYLENPGGVLPPPSSALVTGYDFLADAANAVLAELEAGLAPAGVDTVITPGHIAPADPDSWTAEDLRIALRARRHDLLFLAAHFSASSLLAADYSSTLQAMELLDGEYDLRNAVIYSAGCHSGYNLVDPHAIPGVTRNPDWAQVCARRQATLLAGTGYQYGDTDFIEYSERLYLDFTRQLRAGSGPVALGKALVEAKRRYLAAVPHLKGIHEKALLQATLFGLPMLSVDLPGERVPNSGSASIVSETEGYVAAPGQVLGLEFADITLDAVFQRHDLVLNNAESEIAGPPQVTATWFLGGDGLVANPAEPVLPLEIRRVDVDHAALRGIGFRGGSYSDIEDVIPLTGAATTEIRGVHPAFVSTVFYPPTFWRANYMGEICAATDTGTLLMVTPAQVRTDLIGDSGVFRLFHQTQFRLFYSANVETYNDPDTGLPVSTPALSGPPSISNVRAWTDGDILRFRAQVVGNPAAGIQEVWVTYTATTGAWHGLWQSFDLEQDPADSRYWIGAMPLEGVDPETVRFMVQAVNGVGLVTAASNLGAYFIPNETEIPNLPAQTASLEWLSAPETALYGSRISVSARLTDSGAPLPGKIVAFKVGGLETRGLTGPDGVATSVIHLLTQPGPQTLQAVFAGDAEFDAASAQQAIEVNRTPTTLSLAPSDALAAPKAPTGVTATLAAADGRPLPEQTVLFALANSGVPAVVIPVITDYAGRAVLEPLALPPGDYTILVSFGQPLPPPFPASGSSHPLYLPSEASGAITLDAGIPVAGDDRVPGTPGIALKVPVALLLENDTDDQDTPLILTADTATSRGASITRSGDWLLISPLSTTHAFDSFTYTVEDASGNHATATVRIPLAHVDAVGANIISIEIEGGFARLTFAGIPGRVYDVQFSPVSGPFNWSTLGSATVAPNGVAEFVTPYSGGVSGFFRTISR